MMVLKLAYFLGHGDGVDVFASNKPDLLLLVFVVGIWLHFLCKYASLL